MEKTAFKHDGVLWQYAICFGQPVDLTYYSVLREEYNIKEDEECLSFGK
ncbi:RimJ/RimL family protein N-acetyltransferase [Cytobacillus purgationiresistens]|uniref:RimJ/RimL family protein N-acetyltransferase n=1 Tax=Cytobacillus purgationiresistens TaxID=863449 RepID=A0ABU0AJT4_9BACI|nr:RimJ/RimL family protein N-acetyltransferase [Cytobacillus purgationiresistens]